MPHVLRHFICKKVSLFVHAHLGFNAEGGVWHGAQPGFVDQFTGYAADAVGFIFNAHQGFFQVINESDLAAGHLAQLFPFHAQASVFHGHVPVF